MPQTCQCPDSQQIEDLTSLAAAVAAERDVDIIAEEAAERHMPAAPELRDGRGYVRQVKVLAVAEAEDAAKANGHIGIAGEIEIDLEHEHQRSEPCADERAVSTAGAQRRNDLARIIGKQDLLGKANDKALRALEGRARRGAAVHELPGNLLIAHNGALHHLREHREVEQQIEERTLRLDLTAIDIRHIGDNLEGIERQAEGQGARRRPEGKANGIQAVRNAAQRGKHHAAVRDGDAEDAEEEVQIFEQAQHRQIDDDRQEERIALPRTDPPGHGEVRIGKANEQQHIDRLPHGIEQQAGRQQDDILQPQAGHQKIGQQRQRQKQIEEIQA